MKLKYLNKILPQLVAVMLLIVGVFAGILLVRSPQEFREQAAPATTLFISPTSQIKAQNDTATFSVLFNTGENQVVGLDLALSYDPSVLTVMSISKGAGVSALTTVIRENIDNTNGTIGYSLFTADKTKTLSGEDISALEIVAQINPDAPEGLTTITLSPETSVAALTEGQNVIVNKVAGTIEISGSAEVPSTSTGQPLPITSEDSSLNIRADVNGDRKVNILDLNRVLSRFNEGSGDTDINNDGQTNILDLSIVMSNWEK